MANFCANGNTQIHHSCFVIQYDMLNICQMSTNFHTFSSSSAALFQLQQLSQLLHCPIMLEIPLTLCSLHDTHITLQELRKLL